MKRNNLPIYVYHSKDMDGWCCAILFAQQISNDVKRHFSWLGPIAMNAKISEVIKTNLIGFNFEHDALWRKALRDSEEGTPIVFGDCCPDYEDVLEFKNNPFNIYDHHRNSYERYDWKKLENVNYVFSDEAHDCGATIVDRHIDLSIKISNPFWSQFNNFLHKYVKIWDTGKITDLIDDYYHENPDSKLEDFQYLFYLLKINQFFIDTFKDVEITQALVNFNRANIDRGTLNGFFGSDLSESKETVLNEISRISEMVETIKIHELSGLLIAEIPDTFVNYIHYACLKRKYPNIDMYFYSKISKTEPEYQKISMRSWNKNARLDLIANKSCGGGHRKAAGFKMAKNESFIDKIVNDWNFFAYNLRK